MIPTVEVPQSVVNSLVLDLRELLQFATDLPRYVSIDNLIDLTWESEWHHVACTLMEAQAYFEEDQE